MRFLVCGEGNSDLGTSEEHPGPLMGAVRWCVGQVLEAAPALSDSYRFSRKSDVQRALPPKGGKRMALRHTDEDKDVAVFRRQAHALATLANQGADDGVIFFHDCDFTREKVSPTQRKARHQAIVCAMERGFREANYKNGVPMVPRPRSESWFLCLCRRAEVPGKNYFEDLPGNDKAPTSGKKLLAQALGCKESEIYDCLGRRSLAWEQLQAPSFLFFAKRLRHVTERLAHLPCSVPEAETLMSEQTAR